jgi:hypothetical protein
MVYTFITSLQLDYQYLTSGLDPFGSHNVITRYDEPHVDFCPHDDESSSSLETVQGKGKMKETHDQYFVDMDARAPGENPWVRHPEEECDGCDTYAAVNIVPDSIGQRVMNILYRHPYCLYGAGASVAYWGLKAALIYTCGSTNLPIIG